MRKRKSQQKQLMDRQELQSWEERYQDLQQRLVTLKIKEAHIQHLYNQLEEQAINVGMIVLEMREALTKTSNKKELTSESGR